MWETILEILWILAVVVLAIPMLLYLWGRMFTAGALSAYHDFLQKLKTK